MEQIIDLKDEIETILREKDNLQEEYRDVPYLSFSEEKQTRDFNFPRNAIIGRLDIILKGCEVAIISGGTLGWFY